MVQYRPWTPIRWRITFQFPATLYNWYERAKNHFTFEYTIFLKEFPKDEFCWIDGFLNADFQSP